MKQRHSASVTAFALMLALFKANAACCELPLLQVKESAVPAARVLAVFKGRSLKDAIKYMERFRPPVVDEKGKRILLRNLPLVDDRTRVKDEGVVKRVRERARPALDFYRRSAIVEIVVFNYGHPVIYTKAGAVIALSTTFIDLARDDAALVGAISHELAHEYVAVEFREAVLTRDMAKLRELELLCDALAVVSLLALGMDVTAYANLLRKVVAFSPEAAELNAGAHGAPSLAERLLVIGKLQHDLRAN